MGNTGFLQQVWSLTDGKPSGNTASSSGNAFIGAARMLFEDQKKKTKAGIATDPGKMITNPGNGNYAPEQDFLGL